MRILIFLGLLLSSSLFAQELEYGMGLLVDDETYAKMPKLQNFTKSGSLPQQKSLKKFAPKPGDQGHLQSCVGWALGYGVVTMERAKTALDMGDDYENILKNPNSALYLYKRIQSDCQKPSNPDEALKVLKEEGNCLYHSFDAKGRDPCDLSPNLKHKKEAEAYKIEHSLKLFERVAKPETKTMAVKRQIAADHAVMVGIQLTKSFLKLKESTWMHTWTPSLDPAPIGGHAMVVVGYDDTKQRFELLNSWGEDFGIGKGFFYIKYDDFGKYCDVAYVIRLEGQQNKEECIKASFALRKLDKLAWKAAYNKAKPQWRGMDKDAKEAKIEALGLNDLFYDYCSEAKVESRKKGIYYTTNHWKNKDQYILSSNQVSKGTYVYLFSFDADQKAKLHFLAIDCNSFGANEIGDEDDPSIIPENQDEDDLLIIPETPRNRFEINTNSEVSADYACILYSTMVFKDQDICRRLEKLNKKEGDFPEKFDATFSDLLVAPEDIKYDFDKMSFEACFSEGYIVPLIIGITTK